MLNKELERFKKDFKLDDWEIAYNFKLKPVRAAAKMEVHFTSSEKIASIRVQKEKLYPLDISQITYCIIHELTHLVLDPVMDPHITEFEVEQLVDTLSILIHRGR